MFQFCANSLNFPKAGWHAATRREKPKRKPLSFYDFNSTFVSVLIRNRGGDGPSRSDQSHRLRLPEAAAHRHALPFRLPQPVSATPDAKWYRLLPSELELTADLMFSQRVSVQRREHDAALQSGRLLRAQPAEGPGRGRRRCQAAAGQRPCQDHDPPARCHLPRPIRSAGPSV